MSGGSRIPSVQFQDAASYLSHASSLSTVSNTVKLELYGLFKYATVSATPTSSKPSIFDMTGRAKWDAWNNIGKKYKDTSEAEQRYIQIARDLGWIEGSKPEPLPSNNPKDDGDIWDDPSEAPSRGGLNSMGNTVSSMQPPEVDEDRTIHGLAVSNNVVALKSLLEEQPDTDVNGYDEFGFTPIHLAADRGNREIVQFLLSRGADPTVKDQDDLTPLELAKVAGHNEIVDILAALQTKDKNSNR